MIPGSSYKTAESIKSTLATICQPKSEFVWYNMFSSSTKVMQNSSGSQRYYLFITNKPQIGNSLKSR